MSCVDDSPPETAKRVAYQGEKEKARFPSYLVASR